MRNKNSITRNVLVILILVLSFSTLFHIIRFRNNSYPPVYNQYEHIYNIQKLALNNSLNISVDGVISLFDNYLFVMRLLPLLFGLLSSVLIYYILSKISNNPIHVLSSSIFIILSPVYIYTHIIYNSVFFPLFLILLGILLILHDRYILSIIPFFLCLFIMPKLFFVLIIVLIIFYEKYKSVSMIVPLSGLFIFTYLFVSISRTQIMSGLSLMSLLTYYISDLGVNYGLGIFEMSLAFIGVIISWKWKNEYAIIYYGLISLIIGSIYDTSLFLFISIILGYYAGLAFSKIIESKWESSTLKNYVLLLIICGVVFSSGSHINRLAKQGPSNSELLSLQWLKKTITPNESVLSHYEYGSLIKAIANANVYTDITYYQLSRDRTKIKIANDVFQSRDLGQVQEFLEQNKIKYIWINSNMKKGQVWDNQEQGLLFLLHNSVSFKKVFDYQETEIWIYIPRSNVL